MLIQYQKGFCVPKINGENLFQKSTRQEWDIVLQECLQTTVYSKCLINQYVLLCGFYFSNLCNMIFEVLGQIPPNSFSNHITLFGYKKITQSWMYEHLPGKGNQRHRLRIDLGNSQQMRP